jgi:hypothetical protein
LLKMQQVHRRQRAWRQQQTMRQDSRERWQDLRQRSALPLDASAGHGSPRPRWMRLEALV